MTTALADAEQHPAVSPSTLAVDVRGLTKRFGRRLAVAELDLAVPAGTVAGFIGPNGAGKTTTLRMLLGLVRPSAGDGTVLGVPLSQPQRYLPKVGALIESPAYYPGLSGRRNLEVLAVLAGHHLDRVDVVLGRVGLADRGDDPYRTYSLGMKQRLGIAAALLAEPELLVLDEPTNGLDPTGIREMRELLRTLATAGPTVLVSSHLLSELEQICDWLVVLDHGERVYQGRADELLLTTAPSVLLRPERADQLAPLGELATRAGCTVRPDGERLRLTFDGDDETATARIADLNRAALRADITLVEIAPVRASLEERYQGLVAQKEI
ncbi:MAG: ABC transporter ATP-binding protein [Mycobacteriales bacterium]